MAELKTLFASVDANKITRATDDLNDTLNGTFNFGSDVPTSYGMYFIAEGDERGIDKINVNFKKLAPNFITITNDYTAEENDFIYVDTTSNIINVTLPAGDNTKIDLLDISSNFSVNNLTITPNGTDTIMGNANLVSSVDDIHLSLILVGKDWRLL